MKKKWILISIILSMAVLFSILFQSIHSYEHHSLQIQKKEHHHLSNEKALIIDDHSAFEKCFTCDFSFSLFTVLTVYLLPFYKNSSKNYSPFYYFQQHSLFFKGSLFALRAPPILKIVKENM
ncbi:hypothetical protein DMB65_02430 [Flavobacterium cheongpyeongense]|uniref:DUF2946 domain-containing protein n=1 Tax=Flavobacterium cheongpyeongense TaxID=2212651 RepID=A0A2V4BW78_9FLAO|nr:hypothetical protein [Flavobacterium cheongpyeongense]PXY42113.1 hypothetical protein DMB65_02430 [Flavobacterium cheongpyeongense]